MDTKLIDKTFTDVADIVCRQIAFTLRDQAGIFPAKIRITVIVTDESGSHFSERENVLIVSPELEESYQNIVKARALAQARSILVDGVDLE